MSVIFIYRFGNSFSKKPRGFRATLVCGVKKMCVRYLFLFTRGLTRHRMTSLVEKLARRATQGRKVDWLRTKFFNHRYAPFKLSSRPAWVAIFSIGFAIVSSCDGMTIEPV
jgi:hypothetical protein